MTTILSQRKAGPWKREVEKREEQTAFYLMFKNSYNVTVVRGLPCSSKQSVTLEHLELAPFISNSPLKTSLFLKAVSNITASRTRLYRTPCSVSNVNHFPLHVLFQSRTPDISNKFLVSLKSSR